jgi:hypothetical protein
MPPLSIVFSRLLISDWGSGFRVDWCGFVVEFLSSIKAEPRNYTNPHEIMPMKAARSDGAGAGPLYLPERLN